VRVAQFANVARSLRLGAQGRLVIPAELRRLLALRPGDTVIAWVDGDRLVLRPRRAVEEELWGLFDGIQGSLADELIRERREEARLPVQPADRA
jgi:antitoxin PrlF